MICISRHYDAFCAKIKTPKKLAQLAKILDYIITQLTNGVNDELYLDRYNMLSGVFDTAMLNVPKHKIEEFIYQGDQNKIYLEAIFSPAQYDKYLERKRERQVFDYMKKYSPR